MALLPTGMPAGNSIDGSDIIPQKSLHLQGNDELRERRVEGSALKHPVGISIKEELLGQEDGSRLVKCLPDKHEDLCLVHQNPWLKRGKKKSVLVVKRQADP